jgi:hypothetical protein
MNPRMAILNCIAPVAGAFVTAIEASLMPAREGCAQNALQ